MVTNINAICVNETIREHDSKNRVGVKGWPWWVVGKWMNGGSVCFFST